MSKPKILVTGANGQLGKELAAVSHYYPQYEFSFLSKEALPIQQLDSIVDYFANERPQFCINCAAFTAVDRAETERELAFAINAEATGNLAEVCYQFGTKFIHLSTDYVFNGKGTVPYKEDDQTDPVNFYGYSKLKGEQLAVSKNDQSVIIRTSWVYSEFGNNFVKTMLRLMKEKAQLNIVNDQLGSPTYAADLARVIIDLIDYKEWKPGIYHYSNDGKISWFEFALAIKEFSGSNCIINPIPTVEFPTPAKRPAYAVFDKSKIASAFAISNFFWKNSLFTCLKKLM